MLSFKLKFLAYYASIMRNYLLHMDFTDLVAELASLADDRARILMLIVANVVGPKLYLFPKSFDAISENDLNYSQYFLLT